MKLWYSVLIGLLFLVAACATPTEEIVEEEPIQTAPEPVICTAEYAPVCGADGKTYSNACVATNDAKVEIAYEGECEAVVESDVQIEIQDRKLSQNLIQSQAGEGLIIEFTNLEQEEQRITIPQLEIDETIPAGENAVVTINVENRAIYPIELNFAQVGTLQILE